MKILALDLSTKAIGWAAAGKRCGEYARKKTDGEIEAAVYEWVRSVVIRLCEQETPSLCIIEESNSSKNMITTRLLMGARATALLTLHDQGVETQLLSATSARKVVGINQGFPKGTSKYTRRKETKQRVINWARAAGYHVTTDNEADAATQYEALAEIRRVENG